MKNSRILALFVFSLVISQVAPGYFVGPTLTLNQLAEESDIIFKGEAIEDKPVMDEWFKDTPGYAARETRFKIISQIKGEAGYGEVLFRHYDKNADGLGSSYTPQFYHFEPGRTYVVFADKTATGARQTKSYHSMKMDSGVLRCRDERPVTEKTLSGIYWAEILALRDSPVANDVVYAIRQLDEMSESPGRRDSDGTTDFSRIEVLSAVRGLISRPEPEIAQAAIRLIGDGSPYLSDDLAPFWLGTIGVDTPGLGQFEPGTRNVGGAFSWRDLVAVANSNIAPETRALAIRAMGLVKARQLHQKFMDAWLKAPEIPVRAAAVLLLTDFAVPGDYTTGQFAEFAADPAPEVRKCAAYAIGFMQNPEIVPVLSKLIRDNDKAVRRAAMESLHSFRPEIPAVAAALKQDLTNPESQPLSLLALARENPGAHLEELAKVIESKIGPTNSSGGQIPAFTAWKLLFKHLRAQPPTEIQSGKWDRYLDALEQVGQYSSSEPRDIYAFYLQRGMPERAAKYRAKVKKAISYDIDYYFNMVDKNPSVYEGN